MRLAECVDQTAEKGAGIPPGEPFMQFGESKLAGAINGNEHVELAFCSPNLGDIPLGSIFQMRLPGNGCESSQSDML